MKRAIAIAPAYAEPYRFLVWMYQKEGDLPRAAGWLSALVRAQEEEGSVTADLRAELAGMEERLRQEGLTMIPPEDG